MAPFSRSLRSAALRVIVVAAGMSLSGAVEASKPGPAPKRDLKAEKKVCVEAHANGQGLVREGKFTEAREAFITCGRETCPGAVRKECVQFMGELNEKQPSVVIEARDEIGQPTAEVKVFIDGAEVAGSLDGRAIEVDPGQRAFRYVSSKGKVLERSVLILEGQRNRKLTAVFGYPPPPPPEPFQIPVLSYVLGGVAAGGLGNFVFWGLLGKSEQGELEDSCAPRCRQEDVDAMRRSYLLADLSLGIGVAALGAATVVALLHNSGKEKPPPRLTVTLQPGGLVAIGSF
ncbi:hypothetical protein [Chondromyces crocatus]|nr:hypothetical protein [Chondromyces crocatus]